MNRNKKIVKTMAAAMAGVLAIQAGAYPVFAEEKEETVYVQADAEGAATDIIVSDWLKNEEGQSSVEDHSDLKDIKNVKGDETYRQDGDRMVWDAQGNDIYYQGTTEKKLPVSLHVEYYLDGERIAPEELAGKSGHVKIRYTYENTSKSGEVYTPFMLVSGFILPTDTFNNVKIDNGKIISDGDKEIVIGVGMPGLADSLKLEETEMLKDIEIPDSFEVEADVTDFSLSMSMTVALPLNLEELGIDDIEGWDDLKESLEDLTDASKGLVDGSGELAEGVQTLKDSCTELIDGINEVDENMGTLADGVSTLNGKKGELIDGIRALADGIQTLENKKGALVTGVNDLAKGSTDLRKGAAEVKSGNKELAKSSKLLEAGAKELASGEGTQKLQAGSKSLVSGSQTLAAGSQTLADGIGTMVEGEDSQKLLSGADQLEAGSEALEAGVDAYVDGTTSLADGVGSYVDGVNQYMDSVDQILGSLSGQGNPSTPSGEVQEEAAAGQISAQSSGEVQGESAAAQISSQPARRIDTEEVVKTTISEDAVADIQEVLNNLQGVQNDISNAKSKEDLIRLYASYDQYMTELNDCISLLNGALGGIQQETITQVSEENVVIDGEMEGTQVADATQYFGQSAGQDMGVSGRSGEVGTDPSQALAALMAAEQQLRASGDQLQQGASQFTAKDTSTQMTSGEQLKTGAKSLSSGAKSLNSGVQMIFKIVKEQLKEGADALATGLSSLASGASELDGGLSRMIAGAGTIDTNLQKFVDATDALSAGTSTLYAGTKTLESGAGKLSKGAGTLSSGIGALAAGSSKLEQGAGTLGSGVQALADGSEKLKDGTSQLADGGTQLDDGVSELKDGADELRDGMEEFNEEGIEKLTSYLDEDVQEVIDRLLELQDAGNAYTQFSDSGDMGGTVKFIIETAPIE